MSPSEAVSSLFSDVDELKLFANDRRIDSFVVGNKYAKISSCPWSVDFFAVCVFFAGE
jgi:hypothetical protein